MRSSRRAVVAGAITAMTLSMLGVTSVAATEQGSDNAPALISCVDGCAVTATVGQRIELPTTIALVDEAVAAGVADAGDAVLPHDPSGWRAIAGTVLTGFQQGAPVVVEAHLTEQHARGGIPAETVAAAVADRVIVLARRSGATGKKIDHALREAIIDPDGGLPIGDVTVRQPTITAAPVRSTTVVTTTPATTTPTTTTPTTTTGSTTPATPSGTTTPPPTTSPAAPSTTETTTPDTTTTAPTTSTTSPTTSPQPSTTTHPTQPGTSKPATSRPTTSPPTTSRPAPPLTTTQIHSPTDRATSSPPAPAGAGGGTPLPSPPSGPAGREHVAPGTTGINPPPAPTGRISTWPPGRLPLAPPAFPWPTSLGLLPPGGLPAPAPVPTPLPPGAAFTDVPGAAPHAAAPSPQRPTPGPTNPGITNAGHAQAINPADQHASWFSPVLLALLALAIVVGMLTRRWMGRARQ